MTKGLLLVNKDRVLALPLRLSRHGVDERVDSREVAVGS